MLGHRRLYIDDVRQLFVLDFDQLDRFGRDRRRESRHRSHGMTFVKALCPAP